MELQRLQEQLTAIQSERERVQQQGLDTSFIDATIKDMEQQIAELEGKLNLELRVEEDVRENGYIFDTLIVDGLTMPEIITDDVQYDYARRGVQILVVGMNTSHLNLINALKGEHFKEQEALREFVQAEITRSEQLRGDNTDLEVKNYQLGLENDELSEKVTKIAALQYESDQQIEQQKQHIEDLQNQISIGVRGALNIVEIPQDTSKLAAEIIANKTRITNVKFKDEFGIDRRTKTAVEVLTGKEIEYQEYVEKRYIILNAEQAEQYRADEANKKAEQDALQAAIPTLGEPDVLPVNDVVLKDEAAEIQPFPQGDQVDANANGEDTAGEGNRAVDEVVDEESQIVEVWNNDRLTEFLIRHEKRINRLEDQVYRNGAKISDSIIESEVV